MSSRTLTVIGAGPGGYAAALEAAQRGMTVTLVDRDVTGGTCLNRGCIPSKFFLAQAEQGPIDAGTLQSLVHQKDQILATLRERMDQAVKSAKICRLTGSAQFVSPTTIRVTNGSETQEVTSETILLATGTQPIRPALFPSHPAIHDSTSILSLAQRPEHLVVIGGGYIGCELACAFLGLGSRVTLIEKEPALLATQAEFATVAPVLQRAFVKRGMTVLTGTEVTAVQVKNPTAVELTLSQGTPLQADAILLSLGRRASWTDLNLSAAGIILENQRLRVNDFGQTSVPTIYAIGDLVSALPLAHTAAKEAEIAVAHLSGDTPAALDYTRIPRCIYTLPEVAAVGLTAAQAESRGLKARTDRFHLAASAKAMVENATEGFWAITTEESSGKILGGLIVGAHATELIHLIALSLHAGLRREDIAEMVFAHPSLAEGFHEAMKRSLLAPRKVH